MMSYSVKSSISDHQESGTSDARARVLSELKLYQAFIFSVPILFTIILLVLFYLIYLRRRSVDLSSLRMRRTTTSNSSIPISQSSDVVDISISRCELGLKKELREMLPIIVFNQSFSVKDTQCSVCLGEYKGEDRVQQIPGCGHTFHMECIDLWLSTHTTCPLCRHSLLSSSTNNNNAHSETTTTIISVTTTTTITTDEETSDNPQTSCRPPSHTDERVCERETHVVDDDAK